VRRAVAAEVARRAGAAGVAPPVRDARLDGVAADLGRLTPKTALPSIELLVFLLGHYGIVDPEPNIVLVRGSVGNEEEMVRRLGFELAEALRSGAAGTAWSRVGIGVERGDGEIALVLALQEQGVELSRVPRRLPSRGSAEVGGRLLGAKRAPKVLVAPPSGPVVDLSAPLERLARARLASDPARFRALFHCDRGDGKYQVEVTADSALGPVVVANFPIYCGVDPPAAVHPEVAREADAGGPEKQSPAASERAMFDLINRDRAAAGLPPVAWNEGLARVARAHSDEMAAGGFVAHLSPRTGSAADRVRRAELAPLPTVVSENVGRAYSAGQAQRGFMGSPGHRANVLEPRVTHVGVGASDGAPESGVLPRYFTQLFAQLPLGER
jgi:uncharacterized protein YkwD